jgi:xanthine dehydrogenase accessory factor
VVLTPAREEILAALSPERPCGLVLDTVSGLQLVVGVGERDQSAPLDERRFLRVYRPPVELIVVGAVHIAQALAPMARALGYKVTVVDPRRAFATPERFPGVELVHAWPDEVLTEGRITPSTAVLTLSHDPKIDDPALLAALMSPAFYIGALGSTRTHAQRRQRLDGDMGRIRAPIGLDIGARLPAEIAISILAEIIAARHGKQT